MGFLILGDRSELFDRIFETGQHFSVDAVASARTLDLTLDQTGGLEGFQVLTDGRLRQGQNLDDFPTDALVDRFEMFDDLDPCRMSQSFAYYSQIVGIQV